MSRKFYFIFIVLISIISSCSTDVDLNSDWKETPIVFGLLEPQNDVQYIRINKSFLGSADAYQMAQVADSSNYPYKLDVSVQKVINGNVVKTYYLDTVTKPGMGEGIFANDKNLVYFFNTPLTSDPINTDAEYRLLIKNPVTGLEVNSKTTIAKKAELSKPYINLSSPQISFYTYNGYSEIEFEWLSSLNARIFQLYLRFNYVEYHPGSNDSVQKYFDLNLGQFKAPSSNGGFKISTKLNGQSFYDLLSDNIAIDPSIRRKIGRLSNPQDQIDIMIYAAGDDLSTYMEVNAPSNSIVQDKPNFSNIGNGLGLFSSRTLKTIPNVRLKTESYLHLKSYEKTEVLNFD
ncbi:MAG: hypothetical protein WCK02_10460 [Bacteroidota bacterium]